MAEATLPTGTAPAGWLDRPIAPSWQRIAGLVAHWELLAYGTITLLAFVLRIWDVGARAMHHDESLHAYYAWQFFVGNGYQYNPLMHGPFQFEVVPVFYLIFGASEFSARLLAVVLGTALVFLPFYLRRYLTVPGALLASVMLAVSPSMVYFSRFIRDDIYLACFSLLLFVCVVGFLETHRTRYVYIGAAAMALAMASMEAAYITFFLFGSFLAFELIREWLDDRIGPVLDALRAMSFETGLTGFAIFFVLTLLMFSTFFKNPDAIWDRSHALFSGSIFHPTWATDRVDILGGIAYWLAQHSVMRGGQPWYYYFLVLPLYEQLAVVFGIAGCIYALIRRSLVTTFLLWWAIGAFVLYSWAGEKMPWLSIHITLPFILLAALFLGKVLSTRHGWVLMLTGSVFAALFALEVHSTFALNYQDGANPTELLLYVQTSQDVPNVASELKQLSAAKFGGTSMPVGIDSNDVGGWPFQWYLRDFPNTTYTQSFSGPVCGTQYCPVLLMLGPEYDTYGAALAKRYVVQKYRWNWWFPEDYKQWFPDHVGSIALALSGRGQLSSTPVGTSTDWQHLWNWTVYRQPFGDRAARWLYVLVRRDLVPGSKYYTSAPPGQTGVTIPPVATTSFPALHAALRAAIPGAPQLSVPRGMAYDSHGNLYVADPTGHRIVVYSASGRFVRSWGTVGSGAGQFNSLDSPQQVAIGPDGNVYATDTWNQRIEVFSATGRFLRQWGGGPIGSQPGQFYGPRSIAVSPSGRIYVADTGNERIQVFDRSGTYVTSWGTRGTGSGQFTEPSSVAVGPKGTVYVSDFWNQRIQEFSASGVFVRGWSVADWPPKSYDEPYLAVSPRTGDVFATEPQQQRVLVWTSTGKAIGAISSSQFQLPVGIAVRPDGSLAVSDGTADNVDLFGPPAMPATRHRK